jgi:NAD-dependent SIR2 family protein deacetylase
MTARIRIPEMRSDTGVTAPAAELSVLAEFLTAHRRVLVLTGAGCSTGSGIPAYRDGEGRWLQRRPILYPEFIASAATRRRYWARSYFGWPVMGRAGPNGAHHALAALERCGRVASVITQNVDGLHRRAGQRRLIDLHGRLDRVRCLRCGRIEARDELQRRLADINPDWSGRVLGINADGDAELDARDWPGFSVADCGACGGYLKPEVVFFGESLATTTRAAVQRALDQADAVLAVGTSLVVGSAFRLVREAAGRGVPVVAVNQGRTRADGLLAFKVQGDCVELLENLARALT